MFLGAYLLPKQKDLDFNELLSNLLNDELLAGLWLHAGLAAFPAKAVPRACAAWVKHRRCNFNYSHAKQHVNIKEPI